MSSVSATSSQLSISKKKRPSNVRVPTLNLQKQGMDRMRTSGESPYTAGTRSGVSGSLGRSAKRYTEQELINMQQVRIPSPEPEAVDQEEEKKLAELRLAVNEKAAAKARQLMAKKKWRYTSNTVNKRKLTQDEVAM